MSNMLIVKNKVHGRTMPIDKLILPSKYICGCCWKDRVLVDKIKHIYHCDCGDVINYADFTKDMSYKTITNIGFQSWRCTTHNKHFIAEIKTDGTKHLLTVYEEKIETKPM